MSPSATPDTQQEEPSLTGCRTSEPRRHVAALLELSALGWHVTEIRPGRAAPVLWRVTIRRYDGYASITLTEADPDAALDELLRYAAVDGEAARTWSARSTNVPARRGRRSREEPHPRAAE
ncbi:MAG TPA: hypothetical protein VNO30_27490 [Kofleriaceae bacterium]|nr:hypothetical protein [Kofleriaceae bacterium]